MGYFVLTAIAGTITDVLLKWRLKLAQYPYTIVLSFIAMMISHRAFDSPLLVIKGFLFAQILIFASYYDAKSKSILDIVHILIALISVININPIQSMIGLFAGLLPFLVVGIVNGGIGGGDIKLMGACGLVLGGWRVIAASLIGLTLALLITYILRKDKSQGIPLAPYLGTGCFLAYYL